MKVPPPRAEWQVSEWFVWPTHHFWSVITPTHFQVIETSLAAVITALITFVNTCHFCNKCRREYADLGVAWVRVTGVVEKSHVLVLVQSKITLFPYITCENTCIRAPLKRIIPGPGLYKLSTVSVNSPIRWGVCSSLFPNLFISDVY